MISSFRRFTESWVSRIFFVLMAFAFVGWGISAELMQMLTSPPTWIAKAAGQTIELQAFQAEFQRALAQEQRTLPPGQELPAARRQLIGRQVLDRMVAQAALGSELRALRIVTPDEAVAATVRGMAAFRGTDGAFSKPVFDAVLRNNGYTEDRFLSQLRGELAQRQILAAVAGSPAVPAAELGPLYDAQFEKRSADTALFALAAEPEAAEPEAAVLARWYDNHPDLYGTPEYRRIKAIVLSPESLAKDIAVTEDDLKAAYAERRKEFVTEAKRSVQVVSAPDEAKAAAIAATWRGGADWAAVQEAAKAQQVAALALDDATEVQIPDPDLAKAVFSAEAEQVVGPVKGALGWFVVRVTKIAAAGETPFEDAKDSLRAQIVAGRAADMIYDRANKVDQILGNGGSMEELPGDLGVIGVSGTTDAEGFTEAGSPAPIPGSPALRSALLAAAFAAREGDLPRLQEVPAEGGGVSAYFAVAVESSVPPGLKPYDAVTERVLDDWRADQRRRGAGAAATAMMAAVQAGTSFSDAATTAGVTPRLTALVTRNQADADIPQPLLRAIFALKPQEATMVEAAEGFLVAQVVETVRPDRAADTAGFEQARAQLARSIGGDLSAVFVEALRKRAEPQVNQRNFDSTVKPR